MGGAARVYGPRMCGGSLCDSARKSKHSKPVSLPNHSPPRLRAGHTSNSVRHPERGPVRTSVTDGVAVACMINAVRTLALTGALPDHDRPRPHIRAVISTHNEPLIVF